MSKPNYLSLEALEGRRMLSGAPWGAQARLIGLDRVAADYANLTGAGQSVAVIDSGVDYNHPALGGGWGNKVVAGWDFAGNDSNPMSDSYAHGTGVASMIAANGFEFKGYYNRGIASGAKIIALRQNNSYGVDSALKWVIANKAKYNITAVNITDYAGGGSNSTYQSIRGSLATLASMNVFITSPAGNGGASSSIGSRDVNEAVTGSVNTGGGISGFTSRGSAMDFLAPGEHLTLPYYDTGSHKHIYVDTADGTSWSAPQIAGAAVLIRQINPRFTNAEVSAILRDSGVKTYDSVTRMTFPRLNLYSAIQLAYQRSGQAGRPTPAPAPAPAPAPQPDPGQPAGTQFNTPTPVGASTTIQAEDFDAGGDGVAYHDVDSANRGGNNYRATAVDLISLNDSGSTRGLGMVKAGEWMRYSVNVQQTGTYNIDFRVAALGSGGAFHLEVDGKNVTGSMSLPDTHSWTSYTTMSRGNVSLTAGNHQIRLVFERNGSSGYVGNFNWFKLTRTTAVAPSTGTPYKTFNVALGTATTIQAEDFDLGANGIAYHDTDARNIENQYRASGVDIEKTLDTGGGYDVGYLKAGEWMNYTVNVTKAGTFNLDARLASVSGAGTFHIEVDGKNVTGTMRWARTGGDQRWTTIRKSNVGLSAGKHTIKFVVESTGGYLYAGNVNWLRFS